MMKHLLRVLLTAGLIVPFTGCSEVECPLDSVVVMTCGLRHVETGEKLQLSDSLSITPCGKDTILLNRAYSISEFVLPLKMGNEVDTFLLRFSNSWEMSATDTLFVAHRNEPHFESIDCPASVFHHITHVSWTTHNLSDYPLTIDSVAVKRTLVDYNDIENLQIYLHTAP
jgi:hypothetical protein